MYFRDFHVSTRGYRHINISAFVEIFFPGEFRTHLSILCNPLKSLLKNYYSCYRRFSQQSILTPAIWVFLFSIPELKNNPAKNREQGWRDERVSFLPVPGRPAASRSRAQCQRAPLISVLVVYTKGRDRTITICRDVHQKDLRFSAWF